MKYIGFVMTNSPEDRDNSHNYFANGVIKDDVSETGCCEFFDYSTSKNLFAVVDSSKCETDNADISFLCVEKLTDCVGVDFNAEYRDVFNQLNDLVKGRLFCHKEKKICVSTGMLFLNHGVARAYNVGNTKIFHFKDNKLDKISGKPPKTVEVNEAFDTNEGIKIKPVKKEVAPYLGYMNPNSIVEPYISPAIKVTEGDIFLIASESVATSLDKAFICKVLADNELEINNKVEMLIEAATEKNPNENYTIQIICAQGSKRLFGIKLKHLITIVAALMVVGVFSLFSGVISKNVLFVTKSIKTAVVNVMINGSSTRINAEPWTPLRKESKDNKNKPKTEANPDKTNVEEVKPEEPQTEKKSASENNKKPKTKNNNQNFATPHENANTKTSQQPQKANTSENAPNSDNRNTNSHETSKPASPKPVLPSVEENIGAELPIDFN